MHFLETLRSAAPRGTSPSSRWRVAGILLGALALAPIVTSGAVAAALKATLAVVAVGVVAAMGVRAKRVHSTKSSGPDLHVLSRSSLSPRTGLAVVEFGRQRLLLGYGDGFLQVLSRSQSPAKPNARSKARVQT